MSIFRRLFGSSTLLSFLAFSSLNHASAQTLTEAEATDALQIIGAAVPGGLDSGHCVTCHASSRQEIKTWGQAAADISTNCLQSTTLSPAEKITCLKGPGATASTPFTPQFLGFWAAGTASQQIKDLFQSAYDAATWQQEYAQFVTTVQMPNNGNNPLTDDEFQKVIHWAEAGMPYLERLLVDEPAPSTCEASISDELKQYVQTASQDSWATRNRERGLMMFGCPLMSSSSLSAQEIATQSLGCLQQADATGKALFPETTTIDFSRAWTQDAPESHLHILRELGFNTTYWTRSSPDGRFIGSGGSTIIDLLPQTLNPPSTRTIKVDSSFDPSFFPDNSGFVFQGGGNGTGMCNNHVLENMSTTHIDFREPECTRNNSITLYQTVGVGANGDYMAVSSGFTGDGGNSERLDGAPSFFAGGFLNIYNVLFDGANYSVQRPTHLTNFNRGDSILSPSHGLLISRVSGKNASGQPFQAGFSIQKIYTTHDAAGTRYGLREIGTICQSGGKAEFSHDERFVAIYHYVDKSDFAEFGFASPEDPAFAPLVGKSSNVYIYDLLKQKLHRVTRMGAKQFAQFPHFRSDGWMYFIAKDTNTGKNYYVASDAAVRILAEQ